MTLKRIVAWSVAALCGVAVSVLSGCGGGGSSTRGAAQSSGSTSVAVSTCSRPAAGAAVTQPADLYSQHGVLNVSLDYITSVDSAGRTLYCFVTANGLESPTLHVRPGDTLNISLTNKIPPAAAGAMAAMVMGVGSNVCGAATADSTSVNMHFHGTNTMPTCHSDEVIHTTVNAGQTFNYSVKFPSDEPPGLYWYHPHIHGMAEAAVKGGASGAIIVDGIENMQPAVAGLPARLLVIRDQSIAGNLTPGGAIPSWDLTLNYVPIAAPNPTPAVIAISPGRQEFWRVLNASADSVADVQLQYDGVIQSLKLVALDGVPTGSQDGTGLGAIVPVTHVLIPPAGRAEFIITSPSASVTTAAFITQAVDGGPDGDHDTTRTLALLQPSAKTVAAQATLAASMTPQPSEAPHGMRFAGLSPTLVTTSRKLYFSEVLRDPNNPTAAPTFFITVDGATPTLFSGSNPPAITTTQGSVEQWTIENRSDEVHEFHIHQIHFKVISVNGEAIPASEQQFYDTFQVPYWSGTGPYPSITVLMDFRGPIVGDFVYHCHILAHEDRGMMAIIRVLPRG